MPRSSALARGAARLLACAGSSSAAGVAPAAELIKLFDITGQQGAQRLFASSAHTGVLGSLGEGPASVWQTGSCHNSAQCGAR